MASLTDLGDGRWQLRASFGLDERGQQIRRSRTFDAATPTQARRAAARIETELRAEHETKRTGREHQTFAEATETWWQLWVERDRSPSHRRDYRSVIDRHVLPSRLARVKVRDLTVEHFDRWYADLRKAPVKYRGTVAGRALSPQRINRVHTVVKLVLDQCVRARVLTINVAALAYRPEVRKTRRPFTPTDELRLILTAARAESPVAARAIAFTALTGLRRGEVAGVRWAHIDVTNGVLVVQRNVIPAEARFVDPEKWRDRWDSPDARRRVMFEKDPKSHQVSAIALNDAAVDLTLEQMAWQRSEAAYAGTGIGDRPFLWSITPPFDEPLWSERLTKWQQKFAAKAGCPGVRLHDLRHWQASIMLASGATLADVQARLRHMSAATTIGYLEADLAKQRYYSDQLPSLGPG